MAAANKHESCSTCLVGTDNKSCAPCNNLGLLLGSLVGIGAIVLSLHFLPALFESTPRDIAPSPQAESTTKPITGTDANFASEVLRSDLPVLVDFWAQWCGPCRTMNPIVEAIATEYAGRLKVVKIDVDESPESAAQFGVTSIPTFVVIHAGEVRARLTGAQPKQALVDALKSFLN